MCLCEGNMKIDGVSSQRLSMLRFPLIVGVVYIHAYSSEVLLSTGAIGVAEPGFYSDFVRNIVSQGLARLSVPLFFLMSGYLLFANFEWSLPRYINKLRSRVRTLLVPYLFWNALLLSAMALAQQMPTTSEFFSGKGLPVASYTSFQYLDAIFGVTGPPVGYQWWFIRDLMMLVVLSPLIHVFHKKAARVILLAAFAVWFFELASKEILSPEAFLFFYVGTYLARLGRSVFLFDKYGNLMLALYLPVLLIDTLSKESQLNGLVHNFGLLLGVPAVLSLSRYALKLTQLQIALRGLSSYSFFVFATHEPLLVATRKIAYKTFAPSDDLAVISLYLTLPSVVILTTIAAYNTMSRLTPRFLMIISGGSASKVSTLKKS